jgi:uracil-DNA glycosylase family 4
MKINALKTLYKKHASLSKDNPFYISDAKQFVGGSGNAESKIVFIGEAPGAEEEIQSEPFCGRSGKLLRLYLTQYNFTPSNCFITNVVKFRPPQNRKPTKEEIFIHGTLLKEELSIISPNIIVPIGTTATQFILETKIAISKIRGKTIHKNTILIFPLFHPAYLLRNQKLLPLFENDIQALYKLNHSF